MSKDKDFLKFKIYHEISRQLDYDCGWDLGVKDIFRDIVSDAKSCISRNRKIAELEKKKKKSPKKSVKKSPSKTKECPPGKVLNPKTNRCVKEKKEINT